MVASSQETGPALARHETPSREGSGAVTRPIAPGPRWPVDGVRARFFPQDTSRERTGAVLSTSQATRTTIPERAASAPAARGLSLAVLRLAALALLFGAAVVLAMAFGAVPLPVGDVLAALAGTADETTTTIVRQLRLPRALQAGLVGAALAISGTTFQALVRNPLADPYILGVSNGAALGAVSAIVFGVAGLAAWLLPAAAYVGALVAIVLVFRIAYGVGGQLDTRVLLLAGVVVGAFFNAAILLLLTFAEPESFRAAIFWMMGSHAGATWRSVGVLLLVLVPATALLVSLARALDLLAIGERTATYLGANVERTKLLAYGTASLLTAASVSVSGAIGFVGLVVPHVARMLWGSGHRLLLPSAALLGASFLVLTDLLARLAARPAELPIGVVTAFVGVPFFVWLLRRRGGGAA